MDTYLTKNELILDDFKDAVTIQEILIRNGNVVMLSREENLWIINWIWDSSGYADRNAAIFISREDYEWELFQKEKENDCE